MATTGRRPPPDYLTPREFSGRSHESRCRSPRECGREEALRDLYGEGLADAEIAGRQGQAQGLGALMGGVFAALHGEAQMAMRELVTHWEEIVGTELCFRCAPRVLLHGTLHIEVWDAAWRYRLEPLKGYLLERVRAHCREPVKAVRLVPGGRSGPAPGATRPANASGKPPAPGNDSGPDATAGRPTPPPPGVPR